MLKNMTDIDIFCNKFLQFIIDKNVEGAFHYIQPFTRVSETEVTKMEIQAMKQFDFIGEKYGEWLDYKLVDEKILEDVLVKRVYILRTDLLPIKWQFIFYKARVEWKIINFVYNEDYENLF